MKSDQTNLGKTEKYQRMRKSLSREEEKKRGH